MASSARFAPRVACLLSALPGLAALAAPPADEANVLMETFAGTFGCNIPDLSQAWPTATASVPEMQISRAAGAAQTTSGLHAGAPGAARFTGWVEIETPGNYSFQVAKGSSGSALLSVDGEQLVAAGCGEQAPPATADLSAGHHQVMATFVDDGKQDSLALSYQGADTMGALQVIPAHRFRVANVRMEYFSGNMDCTVPDLSGRSADRVLEVPSVNIERTAYNEDRVFGIRTGTNWAARFTGMLHIARGGRYTFRVTKYHADSAALTIDGHEVFSAGCNKNSPTGIVSLAAGYHSLVVVFADDGWRDELVLSYQGPDTHGSFIGVPASRFSDAEWTLGGEGLDCTRVCRAKGKDCDEEALKRVRTAADIRRVANWASYSCTSAVGWAYPNNPGICTNSRCCLDGSCTGACAYGRHAVSKCSGAATGHYSRLCPCASP